MTYADAQPAVDISVVIATQNRAGELARSLRSLASCRFAGAWEVIVVDNNSTDDTCAVVTSTAAAFPVTLTYVFEKTIGRSAALNAAMPHALGRIIATTDDDVRLDVDWLEAAVRGITGHDCDYVTGRVLPLWPGEPASWWPKNNGLLWGVLGLLDFGPQPIPLGGRAPIGVNAAFKRTAFDDIGLFNTSVGRKTGTLLGQEVREWHLRAFAAGLRGFYLPDMIVTHVIPSERMTKRYFRRWFYWHGVSRAMLYREHAVDMEMPQRTALDFERVSHIGGTPRYLYRSCASAVVRSVRARLAGDRAAALEEELKVWRFGGIVRQRWQDRHLPVHSSRMSSELRLRNARRRAADNP